MFDTSHFLVATEVRARNHSRFCVAAGPVRRATAKAVCEVFVASLNTHGIPDEILTDNGKVFTGRFGLHHTESSSTAFAERTASHTV